MSDHDEVMLLLFLIMATVTEAPLLSLMWFGLATVHFVTAWRRR